MADWDPFAVDTFAAESPEAVKESAPRTSRIGKSELDALADQMYKETCLRRPWARLADVEADLSWYTPVCSFEHWTHTDVKVEQSQGIAYIVLNRPDTGNKLDASMFVGLCDAVFNLHNRKDIRCVVFMAEGDVFCSGSDYDFDGNFAKHKQSAKAERAVGVLMEKAAKSGAIPDAKINPGKLLLNKFWFTMASLPQFCISLVNGPVRGAGMGCLACVDMVVSVESASFCLPEVQEGLVQCILAPHIVAKTGSALAKYMFATGLAMSSKEMQRAGMVNEIVDSVAEGHKKVAEICDVLTACGPSSVAAAKKLIVGVGGQPITEGVTFFTAALLAMVTVSDESRDGMICLQMKKPKPWEEAPIKPLY